MTPPATPGPPRSRAGVRAPDVAGSRPGASRGTSTRRFAVLAVVVCALVLTLAVPLRTYVAQRQELAATLARQEASRAEVTELTQQRAQLQDPAYVEAQARERLRFVKPGDTPYQVQLPDSVERATAPAAAGGARTDPWYSELWGTISAPVP